MMPLICTSLLSVYVKMLKAIKTMALWFCVCYALMFLCFGNMPADEKFALEKETDKLKIVAE